MLPGPLASNYPWGRHDEPLNFPMPDTDGRIYAAGEKRCFAFVVGVSARPKPPPPPPPGRFPQARVGSILASGLPPRLRASHAAGEHGPAADFKCTICSRLAYDTTVKKIFSMANDKTLAGSPTNAFLVHAMLCPQNQRCSRLSAIEERASQTLGSSLHFPPPEGSIFSSPASR